MMITQLKTVQMLGKFGSRVIVDVESEGADFT